MIETQVGEVPVTWERQDGTVILEPRQKLAFIRRLFGLPKTYETPQQAFQFTPPQYIHHDAEPDIGSVCWYTTPNSNHGNLAMYAFRGRVLALGDDGYPATFQMQDYGLGKYRGWSWFLGTTLLPNAPHQVTYLKDT